MIVAACVALYVLISVRHIGCPGLGYDEVMWATVAVGRPDAGWVSFSVRRWPILLGLPYVGALKGYFYQPILAAFGTSLWTIRVPVILMGAAAIVLNFALARRLFGTATALLCVLLLALDPEVVQRVRHDLGPVAPDLLLRAGCLFLLVRYCVRPRLIDALAFWLLAALGVWAKLTFIWYVNAFVLAFWLWFGRSWFAALRARAGGRAAWAAVSTHLGCHLALISFVVWVMHAFHVTELARSFGSGDVPLMTRLVVVARELALFLEGVGTLHAYHDAWVPPAANVHLIVTLGLLGAGILAIAAEQFAPRPPGWDDETRRLRGVVLVASALIFAQLTVTSAADKPWHWMALQPSVALLVAHGTLRTGAILGSLLRVRHLAAAGAAALVLLRVPVFVHLDEAICAPVVVRSPWAHAIQTPAVADLVDVVRRSERRFVFMDWGMWNQAVLYSRQPDRLFEFFGPDGRADAESRQRFADRFLRPGSTDVFVFHAPRATCYPGMREMLGALAAESGLTLRRMAELGDGAGPVFELWVLAPPG